VVNKTGRKKEREDTQIASLLMIFFGPAQRTERRLGKVSPFTAMSKAMRNANCE
jgi:hypothetical protein